MKSPRPLARAPRPMRRPKIDWEGMEQAALFSILAVKHPEAYRNTWHTPNGGHRHIKVAAEMKRQGVKAGVPDIHLAQARGGWLGLFIEFKAAAPNDARVSPEQTAFLLRLEREGYYATVCRGVDEALRVIEQYLAQPRTQVVRQ